MTGHTTHHDWHENDTQQSIQHASLTHRSYLQHMSLMYTMGHTSWVWHTQQATQHTMSMTHTMAHTTCDFNTCHTTHEFDVHNGPHNTSWEWHIHKGPYTTWIWHTSHSTHECDTHNGPHDTTWVRHTQQATAYDTTWVWHTQHTVGLNQQHNEPHRAMLAPCEQVLFHFTSIDRQLRRDSPAHTTSERHLKYTRFTV